MWNKSSQPDPVPSPSPAMPPPAPAMPSRVQSGTLIGETVKIKGTITSQEPLQLNGELEGELSMDQRLTIGPKAKVVASLKAREVHIAGTVKGNVEAVDRVILAKGAHLEGDVKTAGIVIEDGAYFKGGIDIAGNGAA